MKGINVGSDVKDGRKCTLESCCFAKAHDVRVTDLAKTLRTINVYSV